MRVLLSLLAVLAGCGEEMQEQGSPVEETPVAKPDPNIPLGEHHFSGRPTSAQKKAQGQSCREGGEAECEGGACLHLAAAPDEGWTCSKACSSDKDCGAWSCKELFPGATFCLPREPGEEQETVRAAAATDGGTDGGTRQYTGVIVEGYEYQIFEKGVTPFFTPLRFPGHYHDAETDLFENWNRYYDPSIGRYLQPEPLLLNPWIVEERAKEGRSMSAYSYASNNPINFFDPDGLLDCNQTDSTYSCCLKKHPGNPEACGGAPAPTPNGPKFTCPPYCPPPIPITTEPNECKTEDNDNPRFKDNCQHLWELCRGDKADYDGSRVPWASNDACNDCFTRCIRTKGEWLYSKCKPKRGPKH